MSLSADFIELVESAYPQNVFFGGGYMPEEVDDEEKDKASKETKKEDLSGLFSQPQARHFVSLYEEMWSGDVKTKEHPPEGKFTQGAEAIAKWLKSSHDSLKSAVAALNFYRNRKPKNMSKDKHDQILGMLHTAFGK
jgi:hypothetical protein